MVSVADVSSGQTHAVFATSTYSFEKHRSSSKWQLLDLETGDVNPILEGALVAEIVWLDDKNILYFNLSSAGKVGGGELWLADAFDQGSG